MKKFILILNGPNLNLLGRRQPAVYGTRTLDEINSQLVRHFGDRVEIRHEQYNSECAIIDSLHRNGFDNDCAGIALNAGAYTHYSYAIADAIAAIHVPVVEVHLSNIHAREDFRSTSVIAPVCAGSISGFGEDSYRLAIEALLNRHGQA